MRHISMIALATLFAFAGHGAAQDGDQSILGPGLYVFQTRITQASCNDANRTGFVTSYFGAIDGIPGSRAMTMNLLNSQYWPTWRISVRGDDMVIGDGDQAGTQGPNRGVSHFEVRRNGPRFTGTGTRSYNATVDGRATRCNITYDALLRRFDV